MKPPNGQKLRIPRVLGNENMRQLFMSLQKVKKTGMI